MPGEVTADHCERQAYIYIRQSSQRQLEEHKTSQEVQYNLVHRAKALGWPKGKIEIIDEDLGITATGVKERIGFEKLLTNICLGNVGAIFILYASRLARNGKEWHQTLEMCSLFNVLIIDRDTIYDPSLANDRLWLGMQGSFSEYEVKQMQIRAREAILHKASKGEFIKVLPAGLVATEDNKIELDPDQRIRQAISGVLIRFAELGSIRQVSIWYQQNQIELPVRDGNNKGFPIVWRIPVYSTIQRIVTNPLYAGIYIYPKTKTKTRVVDGKIVKTRGYRTTEEDKVFVIEDLFVSYISKEEYYRNQKMIAENANKHGQSVAGSAREGRSILCGLLRCGHCGRKLCVRYRSGSFSPYYFCRGARSLNASHGCLSFNSQKLEQLIENEMLKVLQPQAIKAAILADEKYKQQLKERRDTQYYALEQARYEASRLERQYNIVDPENYLVTKTLTSRWQKALEKVEDLEHKYNKLLSDHQELTDQQRDRLYELSADLSGVWKNPKSDGKIKTRLVRLLVKQIWVKKILDGKKLEVIVHWHGGVHTQYELNRRCPRSKSTAQVKSQLSIRELFGKLALVCEDKQIARILNRIGYVAKDLDGNGNWTEYKVKEIRERYRIQEFSKEAYSQQGLVNLKTASSRLGVSMYTVLKMIKNGLIEANQIIQHAPWEIAESELTKSEVKHYLSTGKRGRSVSHNSEQIKLGIDLKNED
jgi:DNA invertase Pin-like site-specific DNA recombinase